jgi:hypothetical protein
MRASAKMTWGAAICVAAASVAALAGSGHGVRAESALEFLLNETKRTHQQAAPAAPQSAAPPVRAHHARGFDRLVCTRQCDGARMIMAIRASGRDHHSYEAMCKAAGGAAEAHLMVEKLMPADAPAASQTTFTLEGRAAGATCASPKPMAVPIFADTTLRHGDVVAMDGGFRMFVGRGAPPFAPSDFVAIEETKLAGRMQGMRVGGL